MNDQQTGPQHISESATLLSAIGWIGVIALFLIIVFIAYLPNRPPAIGENNEEQRVATLNEVQSKQQNAISSYGWVNQTKNIVRIPVEEALALTVKDYANAEPEASEVKAYAPTVIGPAN